MADTALIVDTQVIQATYLVHLRSIRLACMKIVDCGNVVDEDDRRTIRPRIISNSQKNCYSLEKMDLSFPREEQGLDGRWKL